MLSTKLKELRKERGLTQSLRRMALSTLNKILVDLVTYKSSTQILKGNLKNEIA